MGIHEMYFEDEYFREIVDNFVMKHMTTYSAAFRCLEIIEAFKKRLSTYYDAEHRRSREKRITI